MNSNNNNNNNNSRKRKSLKTEDNSQNDNNTTPNLTPTSPTTSNNNKNNNSSSNSNSSKNKKAPQLPNLYEESIYIHEERQKKREVCYHYFSKPEELLSIIKEIIFQYQQKNVFSFLEFKQLWSENMTTLKPFFESQELYPDVIHILYYGVLGFTLLDLPINGKVSIIYSLYCLYNCQINNPRIPIIITLNYWETLLQYFQDIKTHSHLEAYHAFRFLRKMGAFVFSATLHPISTMNFFKTNSTLTNQPIIPYQIVVRDPIKPLRNISQLQKISEEYTKLKLGSNNTIPSSLNLINENLYREVFESIDSNTISKFEDMLFNHIPGLP